MAIAKLDFNRGQVVNPLSALGDDLTKSGQIFRQQELDRANLERQKAAEDRASQQFEWQKQAQQDAQKEKEAQLYAFSELVKPRQVGSAGALFTDAARNPSDYERAAYTDKELAYSEGKLGLSPEEKMVYDTKTEQQRKLAELALNPTDAMRETRSEQLGRIMNQVQSNKGILPTSLYQMYDNALLADKAAEMAERKELTKEAQDALEKRDKYALEATKASDNVKTAMIRSGSGDTGYSTTGYKTMLKDEISKYKDYDKGIGAISTSLAKIEMPAEAKTEATKHLVGLYQEGLRKGADPIVLGDYLASKAKEVKGDPIKWYNPLTLLNTPTKQTSLDPTIMDALVKSAKAQQEVQQSLYTQGSNGVTHSDTADLAAVLANQAKSNVDRIAAERAALRLTPTERQAAATRSAVSSILGERTPVTLADGTSTIGTDKDPLLAGLVKDGKGKLQLQDFDGSLDAPESSNESKQDVKSKSDKSEEKAVKNVRKEEYPLGKGYYSDPKNIPNAPDYANAQEQKLSSTPGVMGWLERNLPSVASSGNFARDIYKPAANLVTQGAAAATGGLARTGEFFANALNPVTTVPRDYFNRLSTQAEQVAVDKLMERGMSKEEAEKAVMVQELLTPIGVGKGVQAAKTEDIASRLYKIADTGKGVAQPMSRFQETRFNYLTKLMGLDKPNNAQIAELSQLAKEFPEYASEIAKKLSR